MRAHAPVFVLVSLIGVGLLGCARTAEERQLDSMRSDIERIQEERDGTDRPALREDTAPAKAAALAAPLPSGVKAPAPAAEVVRVGTPDDTPPDDYADPDDTTPRPAIRIAGGGRSRAGRRGNEEADVSPSGDASFAHTTLLDPDAKRAYDAALSLVNSKQYGKALDALAAFVVKWPDHPYADHAMFWRGECYFAQGDLARASEEFQGMLARFAASVKAPDALLKLGVCHQRLGQPSQAKECFDRLTQDYPQSEAAHHIPPVNAQAAAAPGPASEDHR